MAARRDYSEITPSLYALRATLHALHSTTMRGWRTPYRNNCLPHTTVEREADWQLRCDLVRKAHQQRIDAFHILAMNLPERSKYIRLIRGVQDEIDQIGYRLGQLDPHSRDVLTHLNFRTERAIELLDALISDWLADVRSEIEEAA